MRIFAQILLVMFFVVLFFAGLVSATLKFALLNYNFWETTFQKYNVYQNLADVSKSSFEFQIGKEGGNKNDVKFLTDLITPDNTKDTVNKNLRNFLDFANGKTSQIIVYLPVEKIPSNILPKNLLEFKSEVPLPQLLDQFNFQGWQDIPLQDLSNIGRITTYLFVVLSFLILILIIFLIVLVEKGKRLIAPGIAFIIAGSLAFLLSIAGMSLNLALSKVLADSSSITHMLIGVIFPPVLTEIMFLWKVSGLIFLILGACLFLIKKPTYNNSK